ncbi:haloacid dehalogenase-like hydrolase [Enterococcus saccharolyticus]|uniref:PEP phosphonomutase n=1 Tax=Candidatus Enterococcus willemsii TaxID=1857215 RepID=A0ABQ6YWN5_9ENTE|nr:MULTISPECIES: haloacid dehalogenase-like hydrolase [Enterococcus]KAF1302121.1 PEP phosphonomutase [Enterococcus sp. CU12B]MCD5001900.1 haloacid dehalogenase-like hydrolase [Enterococcus saccharolyticus]
MVKRLISATASEIRQMNREEMFESIKASEGRVIVSENVCVAAPASDSTTNAELAAAFGADMLLLNLFDCFNPVVVGLPQMGLSEAFDFWKDPSKNTRNPIAELKKLTGRLIGINLEPVAEEQQIMGEKVTIANGRKSTAETFQAAEKLGVDYICLTGNPGTGVTNQQIAQAIRIGKANYNGLIIAGKMHSAGVDEPIMTQEAIKEFAAAGTDILLLPAVGTVPGFDQQELKEAVKTAKQLGMLTMSAIGTSQESASPETIRQIALWNKMCGVDIQHIGDAGYSGVAPAENIYHLSIAIRGMKHTMQIMARSINR